MLALALLAGQLNAAACKVGKAKLGAICGTYTVYEDRTARSGRVIALKFIVIKAEHPSGRAVAFNPGGPGASSTVTAGAIADGLFFRYFQTLHDRYDILLVDLRGTGRIGAAVLQLRAGRQTAALLQPAVARFTGAAVPRRTGGARRT